MTVAPAAAARHRWELQRRARAEAIIQAMVEERPEEMTADDLAEAERAIRQADARTVKILWAEVVLRRKVPGRDRVWAYERLARAAGLLAPESEAPAEGVVIRIGADALGALASIVGSRRLSGDVVEGEAVEETDG